jgi:menaquinone-dependent protoporphyrinogen oxidase
MRVLVTAASRHGSTSEIATWIAEELRGRGIAVDKLAPVDVHDLAAYDGVVIGSAIYEGRWLKAARNVVARTAAQLARSKVWLFSSGPVGDPSQPSEAPDVSGVMARSGALEHRLFAGRLDRGRLGRLERTMIRVVGSPEGDFRDRDAVSGWASQVADRLLLPQEEARETSPEPPAVDRPARRG